MRLALFALLLALPAPALAQSCDGAPARIAQIDAALSADASRTAVWRDVWVGIDGGGAGANAVLAATAAKRGAKLDAEFAAAGPAMGAAVLLVQRPKVLGDRRPLGIAPDPCVSLALDEKRLERAAADERSARRVAGQAGPLAANLALGAGLGLGYGRWNSAALNTALGVAVVEASIFTRPNGARRALAAYREGHVLPADGDRPVVWSVVPMSGAGRSGAIVSFAF
jgi:hypothetical protein